MKEQITQLLAKAVPDLTAEEIGNLIETPPNPEMGDYAFPCFRLAKTLRKAPQMIASDVAAAIEKPDSIEKIEVQGAYVNFFTNKFIFIQF